MYIIMKYWILQTSSKNKFSIQFQQKFFVRKSFLPWKVREVKILELFILVISTKSRFFKLLPEYHEYIYVERFW